MKIMKKMAAYILSLIMIVGMMPAITSDAAGETAITLGNVKWSSDRSTYSFPNATAQFTSDGQKIFCLSVSDGGYFIPGIEVDLGLGAEVTITGISQESGSSEATSSVVKDRKYSSITVIDRSDGDSGVVTNDKIKKFLRNLTFYRNTTDAEKEQKVTVLGNQVKLDNNMTAMAIDGVIHYYKYVQYAADDSVSTWYTAYNAAKSDEQKFNGMRGYLATITSADEQYYIFSNLGGQLQAWIGGARTVNGSMQYDTKQITGGCLNPKNADSSLYTTWSWVCGPEAGTEFYNTNSAGQSTGGSAIGANYICWNNSSGAQEPNNRNNSQHGDPYNQEYALEYGYNAEANWNDYSPLNKTRNEWGIKGYLIEYSPYTTKAESGSVETIEEADPKTVPDVKVIKATETGAFSFEVNVTDPATGIVGPLESSHTEHSYVYNITLDSDVDSIVLSPDKTGATVEKINVKKDGTQTTVTPAGDPSKEIVTVDNIKVGTNTATVTYTVKDTITNTESTYTYNISRNPGADAEPTANDPSGSTPDLTTITKDGDATATGTPNETLQKYIINVPAAQTKVTVSPNPINGATIDTAFGTGGIQKVSSSDSSTTIVNNLSDSPATFTVGELTPSADTVVQVRVKSEDGKTFTIYQYTIKRANPATDTTADVSVNDTTPAGTPDQSTISGPDTSTAGKKIYTITVPNEQTSVEIDTKVNAPIRLDTGYGTSGIQNNLTSGANIVSSSNPSQIKVDNLAVDDNGKVSVKVLAQDGETSTIYEYQIIRKESSNTNIDTGVDDPTPGDLTDDPTVDETQPPKDEVIDGMNQTVKDITVTVPYKSTSVTLVPRVEKNTSNFDTAYGTNGIKTDLKTGTTLSDSSAIAADKKSATIKVNNLKSGESNVVSVKVTAEDGSTCIYRYTIKRESGNPVVISPSLPGGSTATGEITGPTEDTGKSTATDKYYDVKLPNGTDSVNMKPTINQGDSITSVTVDGSPVSPSADGTYPVTGVTTDKSKEIIFTIKDPSDNVIKYHYTISQEKKQEEPKPDTSVDKKDPSITDITVKTDDNTTTPADITIRNDGTEKTIDITVPSNTTDYTFIPQTKDTSTKITEITKVDGPADISLATDGKSFTAKGLDTKTPTVVKITTSSSSGDKITYTVTIRRAEEGVTPDISVEMNGGTMNLQELIPEDVRKNAKEIMYHCCAHTVLAIDKDGTVRSIGRSNKYKSSLVHVIVKGQDNKWTDYTIYIKVNGATKKEEYGTLVDYKGLNYEITGDNTCRVSSWKTNYNTKKKNIVIPDTIKVKGKTYKVTAIAPGAFMRNSKIVTIKIGKNVQEIGNTSFVGLRKLTKFTISKKNKYLKVAGKSGNKAKMILSKNGKTLYSMTNIQGAVTIPNSVTRITEYAGAGNVKMTRLVVPASVKRIDPCAFAHAKKLTYVQFKGKVPEMSNNCIVDQMNYKKGNVYVAKKYYKQYKTAFQKASKKRYGIKQFPAMSHLKKK